jgi:hypothetical protein
MRKGSRFEGSLITRYDAQASGILGADYSRVIGGFRYWIDDLTYVDVEDGFLSDGASSPRVLWWLIPPWGEYGQTVVLHDWLCERSFINKITPSGVVKIDLTRKQIDEILYEANEVAGVSKSKQLAIKAAVNTWRLVANPGPKKVDPQKTALEIRYRQT